MRWPSFIDYAVLFQGGKRAKLTEELNMDRKLSMKFNLDKCIHTHGVKIARDAYT